MSNMPIYRTYSFSMAIGFCAQQVTQLRTATTFTHMAPQNCAALCTTRFCVASLPQRLLFMNSNPIVFPATMSQTQGTPWAKRANCTEIKFHLPVSILGHVFFGEYKLRRLYARQMEYVIICILDQRCAQT